MAIDLLLQEAKGLSENDLMEVVHFVQFIKASSSSAPHQPHYFRKAGIYEGKGWMADDFDAPLDDFKEYM